MKHFILPSLAVLALAACEPTEPTTTKPVTPKAPDVCNAAQLQGLVGQKRSAVDSSKFTTSQVRFLNPDSAVTLDYNENRLNIVLDGAGTVIRVMCA